MAKQTNPAKKRPRGRPVMRAERETRAVLIDAARTAFLAKGYAGASIEAVAHGSGMSTRTIYKTVSNKAELFRMVVGDVIETSIAHLSDIGNVQISEDALFALVRTYAHLVLADEGVQTARIILAEQAKFPELRESYLSSIQQVAVAFDRRFEALYLAASGAAHAEINETTELLRSMINGAQRAAILDPGRNLTETQISAWADRCTGVALRELRTINS